MRSRALKWSNQTIKYDFYRSRFLIPVANASTGNPYTGDTYMTAPWSLSCDELILGFCNPQASAQRLLVATMNIQVQCSYRYWRHSNACCSQLCWCSGNEPNGQTGSTPSLQFIHTWLHFCVWLCFHVYYCMYMYKDWAVYLWFMRGPCGDVLISFSCCTGISPPHGWVSRLCVILASYTCRWLCMITSCRRVNSSWNIYHRLKEPFLATS